MSFKKNAYYFLTIFGLLNLSVHASQPAKTKNTEIEQPRKRYVCITNPALQLTSPPAQPLTITTQPLRPILKHRSYVPPIAPRKKTKQCMTREERLDAMMSKHNRNAALAYTQKLQPLQIYFQAEYQSREQCYHELAKHKNPLQPAPPFVLDSEDLASIIRVAAQRQGTDLRTLIRHEYPGEEKMALMFSRYITHQSRFFKPVTTDAL